MQFVTGRICLVHKTRVEPALFIVIMHTMQGESLERDSHLITCRYEYEYDCFGVHVFYVYPILNIPKYIHMFLSYILD